jgi:aspartate oxidase
VIVKFRLIAALAATTLLGGLAYAQTANPDAPVKSDSPDAAAEAQAQIDTNIPDPEKVKRSAEAVVKMRQALKDVIAKLEEARNSKDVVKLNCVNEKLTAIKGLLRISEIADVNLQEAVAKKESETATHEYTKVSIARTRVNQLRAEAEECIGQLAFRTDENLSVEVEVPDDLPTDDPTTPTPLPDVDVRPAPASPTS